MPLVTKKIYFFLNIERPDEEFDVLSKTVMCFVELSSESTRGHHTVNKCWLADNSEFILCSRFVLSDWVRIYVTLRI